jgi:colicin import membrane protein
VGSLKIVGKAKIGETDVAREVRGATVNWAVNDYNNEAIQSRLSQGFVLAVSGVETAPISIESIEGKIWEASGSGKLKIPVKVTRRADFTANLKLKAAGIAALEKLKEIEIDGKATNATVEIDLKENKMTPGTHCFYLQTQTTGKYRNNPEAANAAEDALKQAEKVVEDRKAEVKATADAKQAAAKAATDSAAKAQAASNAVATISKAAAEAEAFAKVSVEKLNAAKTSLETKPDDQELLAAKESAGKVVEEAEAKSKAVQETKLFAEKAATEAQAKAKADAAAQTSAEKAEAEAPVKLKEAEKKKELAATHAKETAKIAEPREVTVTVYSAPIYLKVTPASTASAK